MKNKLFNRYYLFSCIGVLIASYYPLSMGVRVIRDMIVDGAVMKENYPKYIIPYTPICIAIILGAILMPLCIKLFKKYALIGGASISTAVFFAMELLFERKVVVSTAETVTKFTVTKLENWQMYMCYVPLDRYNYNETVTTSHKTQTAVDILMGDYTPAFKLHFYIISVVLIITVLNCLYGFGQMIKSGEKKRLKSLGLQSACSVAFLGLCILACFTAFWRDGSIAVSPLSATLMALFFILLGVTVGVFVGSFVLGKSKFVSVGVPAIIASLATLLMYIGEMILLNGHLYCLGSGTFFESIPLIVLAPIDLLVIAASAGITALIFALLNNHRGSLKDGRKIQKKSLVIILAVCGIIATLVALFWLSPAKTDNGVGVNKVTYTTVQVLETLSDTEESSYRVGADLPATDFSSIGQILADKLAKEWEAYDGMTEEQRLASSKLWGSVGIQASTWDECEKAIGIDVHNPLESLDWLNKTGYYGSGYTELKSPAFGVPITHVRALANTNMDRSLREIDVTAGYSYNGVKITLTATITSNTKDFTRGSAYNGYATYKQSTMATGSGTPVLVVTTDETNNTEYYNDNYFDPTAYWVKDNVFYTLRVFGNELQKAEIQATLDRILGEI